MLKKLKDAKPLLSEYKKGFYQKSLVLRTDFSRYKREFKLWHPRYFDINRRTQYQKEKRDYRQLVFNSQDPLHFDDNMEFINGGFQRVIHIFKNSYMKI